jgi:hypothetical protein
MTTSTSFLIYTSAIGGEPTFVLACDDSALHWLSASFRDLGQAGRFTIGNGVPVSSDGKCIIDVLCGLPGSDVAITPTSAGHFRWNMPSSQAAQYAELIDGMADFPGACHQYLEVARPDVPVVVVSKGEYDVETLREMRNS